MIPSYLNAHSDGDAGRPMLPRKIDAQATFNALVDWVHDELIVGKKAPGFVMGLSGTDSILAFLVCVKAFEKAGKPGRVVGIHYGEKLSSEQLEDAADEEGSCRMDYDPWFQKSVIPWLNDWLEKNAPDAKAQVLVEDMGDLNNSDAHRWAGLMNFSLFINPKNNTMWPEGKNFWVVGTRNASEKALNTYSNSSELASVQPLESLWKSEILKLCEYLDLPAEAMKRSRIADCKCGRMTLSAKYIEEVDAMLMVRDGVLSPDYVNATIPLLLRGTLQNFIAGQVKAAHFKDELPYCPEGDVVHEAPSDLKAWRDAKHAARHTGDATPSDTKTISAAIPGLIKNDEADAACALVCVESNNRNAWLPEAMMLFNTPGLRSSHMRAMTEKLFAAALPDNAVDAVSTCNARIAHYGFSFPRWLHLAQRLGEPQAVLEHFGMNRLKRDTDIRNPLLPDPQRDLLGQGFAWQDKDWYVEFRRSYIVCSRLSATDPATVVIRNNSYYYGRDRLPSPVYVSWQALTPEELQAITPDMLESSGKFTRWQHIAAPADVMKITGRLERVKGLLNYLDAFETGLNQWLESDGPVKSQAGPDHSAATDEGGFKHLLQVLGKKVVQRDAATLFLGSEKKHTAPWFPETAIALTAELLEQIKSQGPAGLTSLRATGSQLVLLNGKEGDLPVAKGKGRA